MFSQVENDFNLQVGQEDKHALRRLKEAHLTGPFITDVPRYLLAGADQLTSLTLKIDWMDATFCNSQPRGRKDHLGRA